MPEIPLFQGGQESMLPALPGPVLDRERRPRVDAGGTISGLERVKRSADAAADASMEPLMPLDMFAGEARGIEALAGGLRDVGQMVQMLDERRREAKDYADMAEAEGSMDKAFAGFEEWRAQNLGNPDSWGKEWDRRFEEASQSMLANESYSPNVQQRLRASLNRFGGSTAIRVSTEATKATLRRGAEAADAKFQAAARIGDRQGMLVAEAERQQFTGSAPDASAIRIQDAMRTWADREAKNRYSAAVLHGEVDTLEYALAFGKQEAGWTDSDVELMRLHGMRDIEQVREVNVNKVERDILGQISYDVAAGGVVLPSQIDDLVKAGKLRPQSAAPFREAAKRNSHPLPGEWSEFIDKEVRTYDPDADPKSEKFLQVLQKSISLNPDRAQLAQFNMELAKAQDSNLDKGRRVETHALIAGRNQIREAFSKSGIRRAWSKHLEQAFQDTNKLAAFGIPEEKAKEIKALMLGGKIGNKTVTPDYSAAYREFRQHAVTRKAKGESTLTEWEYNLFEEAATAGEDGDIEDPQKRRRAAIDEAAVLDTFDAWHANEVKKNGVPPGPEAVNQKIGSMLNGALQGAAIRSTAPQGPPAPGQTRKVSIHGFEDAPGLASRLPEALRPYAQDFIDAGREHNLDPWALAAIAMHETGNGTSSAFKNKNNAMGISDNSGPVQMSSVRASIMQQARTLARADGPYAGKKTLDQIGPIYAPIGAANDPTSLNKYWAPGVMTHYSTLRD